MANTGNLTIGPPEPTIPCLYPSCNRRFYSRNGRSNHMRTWHVGFVPAPGTDTGQQLEDAPSSPLLADSLSQSAGRFGESDSDHNDSDQLENNYNDYNASDNDFEPFGSSPQPPNAGSFDQACTINRTNHPIINGELLFYYQYSPYYSPPAINFQGRSVTKTETKFHQIPIHHLYDQTVDHTTGLLIITGSNSKWPTFSIDVTRCPLDILTLFSTCGLPLLQLIRTLLLFLITWKCTMPSTQLPLVIFLGAVSPSNTMVTYLEMVFDRGWTRNTMFGFAIHLTSCTKFYRIQTLMARSTTHQCRNIEVMGYIGTRISCLVTGPGNKL